MGIILDNPNIPKKVSRKKTLGGFLRNISEDIPETAYDYTLGLPQGIVELLKTGKRKLSGEPITKEEKDMAKYVIPFYQSARHLKGLLTADQATQDELYERPFKALADLGLDISIGAGIAKAPAKMAAKSAEKAALESLINKGLPAKDILKNTGLRGKEFEQFVRKGIQGEQAAKGLGVLDDIKGFTKPELTVKPRAKPQFRLPSSSDDLSNINGTAKADIAVSESTEIVPFTQPLAEARPGLKKLKTKLTKGQPLAKQPELKLSPPTRTIARQGPWEFAINNLALKGNTAVAKYGRGGQQISQDAKDMAHAAAAGVVPYKRRFLEIVNSLSKKEFDDMVTIVDGGRLQNKAKQVVQPSRKVKDAARAFRELDDDLLAYLQEAGLPVKRLKNHWPRLYTPEVLEAIEAGGKRFDKLAEKIAKDLKIEIDQARALLHSQKSGSKRAGTAEFSRVADLDMFRRDPGAYIENLHSSFQRAELVRRWGADIALGGEKLPAQAAKLVEQITNEYGRNAGELSRRLVKQIAGSEDIPAWAPFTRTWRAFNANKLVLAVIPNSTQTLITVMPNVATPDFIRAVVKSFTKEGKLYAESTGATEMISALEHQMMVNRGKVGKMSEAIVKYTGFKKMEQWNRTVSALAGKYHAERLVKRIAKGGRRSEYYKKELSRLGGSTRMTPEETLRVGYEMSQRTQFSAKAGDIPLMMSSEGGRFLGQFKNFAYNQSALLYNEALKPAYEFARTGGKSGTLAPLAKSMVLIPLSGLAVEVVRDAIKGNEINEENLPAFWMMANLAVVGGGFGMAADGILALDWGEKGVYNFMGGPAMSDTANILMMLKEVTDDIHGDKSDEVIDDIFKRTGRVFTPLGLIRKQFER